ncbi:hypothetical protein [Streptomyces scabiei]|uniref:hypothetical protein n=1 Tax=Streptomyces scabiei TaxID=1930 RepID=UPI0027E0C145|nr:hypothetical protein [Streptomyces sp. LBUM 1486]
MNQLPEQPAETAGQPTETDYAEARRLLAALDNIPTSFRDETPVPPVGTALPVPQPGRPPMSQGATDASVLMIAGAGSLSMVSVSAGVLMYLSQYADPVVCGIVLGAPTAVLLAAARLVRKSKQAEPPVIHQHYTGNVDQRTTTTQTRGVWATTRNQLPRK